MKQSASARTYFLTFGGIFFLMSSVHLVRFYSERDDIWWTPKASSLSLEQARERVEVYVRGVLLQDELRSGRLQLLGPSGPTSLGPSDIGIRLNNVDRVKVLRLPLALAGAAGAGAAGVTLLMALLGWVPSREGRS